MANIVQCVRHEPSWNIAHQLVDTPQIFLVNKSGSEPSSFADILSDATSTFGNRFLGGCIDSGASKCVVGRHQAQLYCAAARIPFKLSPSNTIFRFGNGKQRSLGKIPVRIPTPIGTTLFRNVDVVAADVPLLLGFDFMDEQGRGIYVDNTTNEDVCKLDG